MRVCNWLWRVSFIGSWDYTSVKATLDRHSVVCDEKYNISKVLDNNTGNIDSVNLTEWKNKTLDILQKTYNGVELNRCDYHPTLWNDNKIEEVKQAVEDAARHLEVSVQNFELSLTAVDKAVKRFENASNAVQAANNSLLASDNGRIFCEIVDRFRKSNKNMGGVEKSVTNEKQDTIIVLASSSRVHEDVKAADGLVSGVAAWLRNDDLTPIPMLSGTDSFEKEALSVSKVSDAASTSVRSASQASKTANTIEKEVKAQIDSLKRVQAQLGNMNAVTGNKISNATFEACNSRVSEILKKKSSEAIRHIAKFNMSLLSELNATLHKIDGEADVIVRKLSGVNSKVKVANSSAREASLFAKQATENVKQTIVKVLSGVVTKLYTALSELRALDDKPDTFSVHAANASVNVSEWVAHVDSVIRKVTPLLICLGPLKMPLQQQKSGWKC
ncbi:hypothetical protein TRVL_09026 [Trypanosoma vivax]|nr:hypothetical protein TRVL_09026 [Trypanosoma vivax]